MITTLNIPFKSLREYKTFKEDVSISLWKLNSLKFEQIRAMGKNHFKFDEFITPCHYEWLISLDLRGFKLHIEE